MTSGILCSWGSASTDLCVIFLFYFICSVWAQGRISLYLCVCVRVQQMLIGILSVHPKVMSHALPFLTPHCVTECRLTEKCCSEGNHSLVSKGSTVLCFLIGASLFCAAVACCKWSCKLWKWWQKLHSVIMTFIFD